MKAIVDCNNFYCSCERLFQPSLQNKPVVVLSNNDGCIVSRSDEAKKLGIQMAGPYFQARPLIQQHGIAVFSSNYNLYGDLSWRVMETLRILVGTTRVEVYSVDEAFLDLDGYNESEWKELAIRIRNTVWQWTGIQVSVGIAPTKVLAKVANRLAKKDKHKTGCILVLDTPEKQARALRHTPVEDIWGVGRQYAEHLRSQWGIYDAWQLSQLREDFGRIHLGGVTGIRLLRELKGQTGHDMEDELVNKKMIATTRMFGHPVGELNAIREAIATYTSRAAEKLRRQFSAASQIHIFIVSKEESHSLNFRGSTHNQSTRLPVATSATHELIKPAVAMAESLFQQGKLYKKAGVMLGGIVPDHSIQGNLFEGSNMNRSRQLMGMIDNINFSQRDDILKFASSGTTRNWKMRQELRSPRYTTRWNELYKVS